LVKHYNLPLQHLALTRAHRKVEGDHRSAAWASILNHVTPTRRGAVVRAMNEALEHWLAYRDEVAEACGLRRETVVDGPGIEPEAVAR
jgi:pyrroloquinoline-quinone synthase